jgi:type II secretory pathway component PulC
MRARALVTLFVSASLSLGSACGGSSARRVASPAAPASASGAPGSTRPDHTIFRSEVKAAIARGLGAFLQRVELADEPVFVAGRFHGFRIAALHDPPFWEGVDLKPGDVVTSVNGLPIERPEQALAAFESLQTAKELRVAYERQGRLAYLVYPILDDR